MSTNKALLSAFGLALGLGIQTQAIAKPIMVTVENLTPAGGLYFTPLWYGFHDGSFDGFNVGANASASIEALAEGGDASGLSADIRGVAGSQTGTIAAPAGFGGAPVFDPLDSAMVTLDIDPLSNRYFSYASMVIPSNDAFFGNDDPYELFDAVGMFNGPLEILVLGTMIWDAGTELNDGLGAAFSTNGGTATDTTQVIALHGGLGPLLGSTTVAGTMIDPVLGDFTQPGYQLARITIAAVPEPHAFALFALGLGMVGLVGRKRSSKA